MDTRTDGEVLYLMTPLTSMGCIQMSTKWILVKQELMSDECESASHRIAYIHEAWYQSLGYDL